MHLDHASNLPPEELLHIDIGVGPTNRSVTGTIRRTDLSSKAQTSTLRGALRPISPSRYVTVRPVSTMSSTSTTSRPPTSMSRSFTIRTRPVPGEYAEMARKSTSTGDVIILTRSARNGTLPLSTPTNSTPPG